jgi:hypothetical protein
MNKAEILKALEDTREQFLDAIENLPEGALEEPGVVDEWSIKQVMDHISRWEAEVVKLLWQANQGERPSNLLTVQVDVDQINAQWAAEALKRPLQRVLDDFHGTRTQTIRRVEDFSDRDLTDPKRYPWAKGQPLSEWIAGDSFEHEAEHTVQVLAWRKKKGI